MANQIILVFTTQGNIDDRGSGALSERIDSDCEKAIDPCDASDLLVQEIRPQLSMLESGYFAYVLTVLCVHKEG